MKIDDTQPKSTRQRWKELHRARRVFLRDQQRHFLDLMIYGSCKYEVRGDSPAAEYVLRAMDMLLNPPMIVDPLLSVAEFRHQPRKLP